MPMNARDRQVAIETVRPRSECPACNPPITTTRKEPPMQEFALTFGSNHVEQPLLPDTSPHGWYKVVARDEEAARHLVYALIGNRWSNLTPIETHLVDADQYYPLGEIGVITIEALVTRNRQPNDDAARAVDNTNAPLIKGIGGEGA